MDADCDGDVYLWACSMFTEHGLRDPVIVAHDCMQSLAETEPDEAQSVRAP